MAAFSTLIFFLASYLLGAFSVLIVGIAVIYHYLSLLQSSRADRPGRSEDALRHGGGLRRSGESAPGPSVESITTDEKVVLFISLFLF